MSGIDAHAHIFSATAPAVAGARYRPNYASRLAAWRALWPEAGITHGVLVQPSFFGTNNNEMLAAVATDPAHLRGVAVVDPGVTEGMLRRLHDSGVRAVRLNLRGLEDLGAYSTTRWHTLLQRVEALGWHVELFVDSGAFSRIAAAFRETSVRLVLDHFGNPGEDDAARDATFAAVDALSSDHEVWCKLSGAYRIGSNDPQHLATRWMAHVGPSRLVWGSDWPWTQHERGKDYLRMREALERWVGRQAARAVLWDNAARLYGFDH